MSFLEIGVFLGVAFILYWLLGPLQNRLESHLYKLFRKWSSRNGKATIDVTDSFRREK